MVQFTQEQCDVIAHNHGPAVVTAVAGSGKTTTMKHRIQRLVNERIFKANRILATTFNVDAQRDLQKAIHSDPNCREVDVFTLNGLGHRIILEAAKRDIIKAPVEVVSLNHSHFYEAWNRARQRSESYTQGVYNPDVRAFLDWVEGCKNTLQYPDLKRARLGPQSRVKVSQAESSEENPWFLPFWQDLDKELEQQGIITYTDQLRIAWELLHESPSLRMDLQNRWDCVVVDEYQDLNQLQEDILDLLTRRHRNYMAVGDDDQTIYTFRQANPDFILNFKDKYEAASYPIQANFRCPAPQLALAQHVIEKNKKRIPKVLRVTKTLHGVVDIHEQYDSFSEAKTLVNIAKNKRKETPLLEQRVLVRAWGHALPLEIALAQSGLPYEIEGGASFNQTKEARLLMTWTNLLLIEHYHDAPGNTKNELIQDITKHFIRDVRAVNPFIKADVIRGILEDLPSLKPSQAFRRHATNVHAWNQSFMTNVASFLEGNGPVLGDRSATDVLGAWLAATGIKETLQKSKDIPRDEVTQRIQNLNSLTHYSEGKGNLPEFMSLVKNFNPKNRVSKGERLIITSMHRSKGMEWSIVHLYGISADQCPIQREDTDMEEERRLFYVALTRSKAETHIYPGETPSPFLSGFQDILQDLDDAIDLLSHEPTGDPKHTKQVIEAINHYHWSHFIKYTEGDTWTSWANHALGLTKAANEAKIPMSWQASDLEWCFNHCTSPVDYDQRINDLQPSREFVIKDGILQLPERHSEPLPKLLEEEECPDYPLGSKWMLNGETVEVTSSRRDVSGVYELTLTDTDKKNHYVYSHIANRKLSKPLGQERLPT